MFTVTRKLRDIALTADEFHAACERWREFSWWTAFCVVWLEIGAYEDCANRAARRLWT